MTTLPVRGRTCTHDTVVRGDYNIRGGVPRWMLPYIYNSGSRLKLLDVLCRVHLLPFRSFLPILRTPTSCPSPSGMQYAILIRDTRCTGCFGIHPLFRGRDFSIRLEFYRFFLSLTTFLTLYSFLWFIFIIPVQFGSMRVPSLMRNYFDYRS